MTDSERFELLCRKDIERLHGHDSIGTYMEKRLHRILKSYMTEDPTAYEVPIGRFVADIMENRHIFEIQTKHYERLLPKLRYYLCETDFNVTVVCPIIRNKRLIRIDPETGEILRQKMSPSHGRISDIMPDLYHIREYLQSPRLTIKIMIIDAEEYRYSERVRYRRTGAYDSELFPVSLVEERDIKHIYELLEFLPEDNSSFSAAQYSKFIGQRGRDLYSSLNLLCYIGLLHREKQGNKYIYKKTDTVLSPIK